MKEILWGPELNDGKNIFVFGSNLGGFHGAGAAKIALNHWGARYYNGMGREGNSYAIPTKDEKIQTMDLDLIKYYIYDFLEYAKDNPKLTFLVTRIGCGLAGYSDEDIAPMFKNSPPNCIFQPHWERYL